jgi:hypothetical protein
MYNHLVSLLLLLGFFLTPQQMAQQMLKKTVVDLPRIEVKGTLVGTPATPVTIVYDRQKDEATLTVGTTATVLTAEKLPPWLRLFFWKSTDLKGTEQADLFVAYLGKLGIDTEKKLLSTTGPEGDILYLFGRDAATADTPHLALYRTSMLPFRLSAGGIEAVFSDYHKSVLPLAFPGRIELRENGSVTTYSFVRDEYR